MNRKSLALVMWLSLLSATLAYSQIIGGGGNGGGGGGGGGGFTSAGNGLTANGSTVSLTTPVSPANGGTGFSYSGSGSTAANGIGALGISNNLSDLASVPTALSNLGLSPVPISQGGTNATSAASALTNLGAAASGTNSDILSLTGLTTPLSHAQGGTECKASTFGTLPVTPAEGTICTITNAAACTAGTAVTTTGSTHCTVTYVNGSWLPAGGASSAAAGGLTTASHGLTVVGSDVQISPPVSVANGGTNATTAGATAAHNIGAAATGVDINTSDQVTATHLASPLPVNQGGTQCGAPVNFGSLPGSPTNGEICNVLDSSTGCVAGTAVTAGGASTHCQVTWNGSNWMPAGGATSSASGGLTTASHGLTAVGSDVQLVQPVPISAGGTNSTTAGGALTSLGALAIANNLSDVNNAATARTNLSAAASGANSDITSLTGLTTPLGVAYGGVGCAGAVNFSQLPSPVAGDQCLVKDAVSCTAGQSITTGGGTIPCGVVYTGTAWVAGGASSATGGGVGSASVVGALPYYSATNTISSVSNTVLYATPSGTGNPIATAFSRCPSVGWSQGTYSPGSPQITDSNGNIQVVKVGGTTGSVAPTSSQWNKTFRGTTLDGTVTWINAGPGTIASSPCTVILPPGSYNLPSALPIGVGGASANEKLILYPGATIKVVASGTGQAGIVVGNKGVLRGNDLQSNSVNVQSGASVDAAVESWCGFASSALGLTSGVACPNMDVEDMFLTSGAGTVNNAVLWVAGVEGQGTFKNLQVIVHGTGQTAVLVDDTLLGWNALLFDNLWIQVGNHNTDGINAIGYDIEAGHIAGSNNSSQGLQIIGGAVVDFAGTTPIWMKVNCTNAKPCRGISVIGTYIETCCQTTGDGIGVSLNYANDFEMYGVDINGGFRLQYGITMANSTHVHVSGVCQAQCVSPSVAVNDTDNSHTVQGPNFDYLDYTPVNGSASP